MSDPRSLRAYHAGTAQTPAWVYGWRGHLLSLLGDWDRVLKGVRGGTYPGKELAAPVGGVREVARPCSYCKQPTVFTTPRGRSVHPTCEGWLDTLTDEAMADVVWSVSAIIPITRVEVSRCPFDPAHTLGAPTRTDSQS